MAEENAPNRRIIGKLLSRMGHQAVLCHDGAEAVATWEPGAFDCLLMDISMPKLSGIEALHEIRKQAGGADLTPVFAVTAHTMPDQVDSLLAEGFDGVLSKPIRTMDLRQALLRCRSESRRVDL